jgi:hypothetical protein
MRSAYYLHLKVTTMRHLFIGAVLTLFGGSYVQGGSNPFIDPEGFRQYVDRADKSFQARLEEQQKAARK